MSEQARFWMPGFNLYLDTTWINLYRIVASASFGISWSWTMSKDVFLQDCISVITAPLCLQPCFSISWHELSPRMSIAGWRVQGVIALSNQYIKRVALSLMITCQCYWGHIHHNTIPHWIELWGILRRDKSQPGGREVSQYNPENPISFEWVIFGVRIRRSEIKD